MGVHKKPPKELGDNWNRKLREKQEPIKIVLPDGSKKDAPIWLRDRARQEYEKTYQMLEKMGVMSGTDVGALALLAEAWDRYFHSRDLWIDNNREIVQFSEKGGQTKCSIYQAYIQANDSVLKLLMTLGMTPTTRTNIKMDAEDKKRSKNALDENDFFTTAG